MCDVLAIYQHPRPSKYIVPYEDIGFLFRGGIVVAISVVPAILLKTPLSPKSSIWIVFSIFDCQYFDYMLLLVLRSVRSISCCTGNATQHFAALRSITQQCSIPARFKTKKARGVRDILFARFICWTVIGPLKLLGLSRGVTFNVIGQKLDRMLWKWWMLLEKEGRNDDMHERHFIKSNDIAISSQYCRV